MECSYIYPLSLLHFLLPSSPLSGLLLGLGVLVGLHILAGFLTQQFGSEAGIAINTIYENWIFQLVIFFLVIFHAVNGLRVVILDLWPALLEYQREAIWLQWLVFIPLYTLVLFVVIKDALGL